jgi:RNA polymerase sigma-70 factor, ECF subfamily
MTENSSFDELMNRLHTGDDAAAAEVFRRFTDQLIHLARCQLDAGTLGKTDPEDVVQSVYRSFFTRYRAGQFDIETWNELWGLLTTITLRKCVNRVEYFQAERRDVRREVNCPTSEEGSGVGWEALDREPTPLEAVVLAETVEQVLLGTAAVERPIVELSLQGYTALEISSHVHRSERTVRRVRARLKKQLQSVVRSP